MNGKLGEDIISMYKPYRNDKADWKTTVISKQKFEIYGRYETIDVSKHFLIQSARVPTGSWWPLRINKPRTKARSSLPLRKLTRLSNIKYLPKELSGNSGFSSS